MHLLEFRLNFFFFLFVFFFTFLSGTSMPSVQTEVDLILDFSLAVHLKVFQQPADGAGFPWDI